MDHLEIELIKIKSLKRKLNEGLTMLLVLKGQLSLERNGQTGLFRENELAVINDGDVYSAEGNGTNVTVSVFLSPLFLLQNAPELQHRQFGFPPEEEAAKKQGELEELKHWVANITFLYLKKAVGYEMQIKSEIYRILYSLRVNFSEEGLGSGPEQQANNLENDARLQQVLTAIHQNYRLTYSLSDAAGSVYLTPQYLSKLFRQKMGMTFLDYLNRLRLEYAGRQLLYSDSTIVKIAMESGFASEKAFGERFRKEYGVTPAVYRTTHRLEKANNGEETQNPEGISLEALVKFMEHYELEETDKEERTAAIDVAGKAFAFCTHQNIIDLGPVSLTLRSDVRNQLTLAQEKLACSYVRFHLLNQKNLLSTGDRIIPSYDYYSIFAFFRGLKLRPFIVLPVEEFLDRQQYGSFQLAIRFLTDLMDRLKNRCDSDYFESWRFEITGDSCQLNLYFQQIYDALASVFHPVSVGIQLDPDDGRREMAARAAAGGKGDRLSFLTFRGDPNISRKRASQTVFDGERQRHYFTDRAETVRQIMEEQGLASIPLYLVEWNTLTGSNVVEAGEFHRSALVADILSGLSELVSGFSYWLNLLGQEPVIPELNTYPLSLFYYQDVPRALLFLATFLNNQGQHILYRDSNVLCLRKSGGQLVLVLFNPCYTEPFEALDNIRKTKLTCKLRVVLENMKNGRYAFKRFVLDKNNGSLYRNWINVDFTLTMYDDMTAVLKSGSSPSMSLYCQEVDGKCLIERELPMNGIAIYEINTTN